MTEPSMAEPSLSSIRFILASASPARRSLLRSAGVEPEVVVSGVDEDDVTGRPADVALVLAQRKAAAVADRIDVGLSEATDPLGAESNQITAVLGCDSVLELNGVAHGKPPDAQTAISRWKAMRGRHGVLHTGHSLVLIDRVGRQDRSELASARVRFGQPSDAEIDAYVATGEPLKVAGGFTLDRLGGWFVDSIDGDPGTVLGLSLPLLRKMLRDVNLTVPTLWGHR